MLQGLNVLLWMLAGVGRVFPQLVNIHRHLRQGGVYNGFHAATALLTILPPLLPLVAFLKVNTSFPEAATIIEAGL